MKAFRLSVILIAAIALLSFVVPLGAQAMEYHQAPMLDSMDLPPVADRLPAEPLVVEPTDNIGVYGGTWHLGLRGTGDEVNIVRNIEYEGLVRWDPQWKEIIPNIAKSWEANDEGTEYTFHLREGMKWSDGEPFTADDILFWYEADATNTEINPAPPNWMVSGGEVGKVEVIDPYTVKFSFAAPNGLFLQRLATPDGMVPAMFPKHWASQFHPDYNPGGMEAVQALMDEVGVDTWVDLWVLKVTGKWHTQTPQPQLWAWTLENGYTADVVQITAVRNPYYWKVDPEGNQYPYIDKVQWNYGEDVETLVLQALNGDIDFQDRHIATLANKAVFADNMEAGGYHFTEIVPASMNYVAIAFNLTDLDPVKREIFQNKDFRAAMSVAIDRQAIIDLIYVGQGEPYQLAPRPTSPYYNEQLAHQYTEYDPEMANQMLDSAGFDQRDADGYRLGPDGNRITFSVDVIATLYPEQPDVIEQVVGYWQAVGIDARVNVVERDLLYQRKAANQQDASVWGGDGGLDVVLEPRWYFPFSNESHFAEAWQYWYNNPADERAEEPVDAAKQQMALYDQLKATADLDKQNELMGEILQIAADQFWAMGIVLPSPGYGIQKNNFFNVPQSYPNAWLYPHPGPTNPFQYYIQGEA